MPACQMISGYQRAEAIVLTQSSIFFKCSIFPKKPNVGLFILIDVVLSNFNGLLFHFLHQFCVSTAVSNFHLKKEKKNHPV